MLQSLAITPDGNRRYAKKHGLSLEESYRKGFEKAEEVFDWCLEIPTLKSATIYALSSENLKRSKEELDTLYFLFDYYFKQLAKNRKIHDNEVKVRVIGRTEDLEPIRTALDELHAATEDHDRYTLNIALGYGGRQEIIDAIKKAANNGGIESLTEDSFSQYLYQPIDIDLMIRTGASHRLSNFMLWQSSYAELYFLDKLWPEFEKEDFQQAIDFYNQTKRNFGK
jgi:tritrans,polycis-undecaprenyl-diphosphate synthase [geranylgeranyl-diphosphate specific]